MYFRRALCLASRSGVTHLIFVCSAKPIPTVFAETLRTMGDHVFVSFDLDSVRCSDAPGVSCPGTIGLTAEEAVAMCYEAGKNDKVGGENDPFFVRGLQSDDPCRFACSTSRSSTPQQSRTSHHV